MTNIVTDRNFNECFREFLKANPHMWRMMRRGMRPSTSNAIDLTYDQENVWLKYLTDKGFGHREKTWRMLLASGHSVMVPCESPEIFDLAYVPSPTVGRAQSPQERERVARGMRALVAECGESMTIKKVESIEQSRTQAREWLDAYDTAQPAPKLSAELIAKLKGKAPNVQP